MIETQTATAMDLAREAYPATDEADIRETLAKFLTFDFDEDFAEEWLEYLDCCYGEREELDNEAAEKDMIKNARVANERLGRANSGPIKTQADYDREEDIRDKY